MEFGLGKSLCENTGYIFFADFSGLSIEINIESGLKVH